MATSSVPGPANAPQQCSSLQEVLQAQVSQYLALHDPSNPHNYALICYEDAAEEEFADAFPPFPSSVQLPVIDATLDDPVYLLSGAVKFRDFMDSDGRFMFPVPAPYKSTLKDPAGGAGSGAGAGMDGYGYSSDSNSGGGEGSADERAPPRAHRGVRNGHNLLQLANMRFGAGADTGAATNFSKKDTRAANIDFNLPLMQLFLATLFPWIFVRPLPRATHRQQ